MDLINPGVVAPGVELHLLNLGVLSLLTRGVMEINSDSSCRGGWINKQAMGKNDKVKFLKADLYLCICAYIYFKLIYL